MLRISWFGKGRRFDGGVEWDSENGVLKWTGVTKLNVLNGQKVREGLDIGLGFESVKKLCKTNFSEYTRNFVWGLNVGRLLCS